MTQDKDLSESIFIIWRSKIMNAYDYDTMVQFVHEEDVKFIRLAFVDVFGVQKNISIMPGELERAFRDGISFDASSIEGFGDEVQSDLFLFPDPKTMSILPWRQLIKANKQPQNPTATNPPKA